MATAPELSFPTDDGPRFLADPSPRARLLFALAVAVSERSYGETTVADVVRIARVSRRTFYEHFDDLADCFIALGVALDDYLLDLAATTARVPGQGWRERIEASMDAYLDALAANPGLTRSFLLELFALGERGLAYRRDATGRWAAQLRELIEDVRVESPQLNAVSELTALAIVGGLWELSLQAAENPGARGPIRDAAVNLIADTLTAPR